MAHLERATLSPPGPSTCPATGSAGGVGRPVTFDACVDHVLGNGPERFALCGYSFGGRIALQTRRSPPPRTGSHGSALVSTTAGIEDPGERARRRADRALAEQLEEPY